jgi:hypothetical protein
MSPNDERASPDLYVHACVVGRGVTEALSRLTIFFWKSARALAGGAGARPNWCDSAIFGGLK